ncbi:MAG: hypothetical protein WCJ72_11110 [Chryseobacterium sp.]
MKSIYQTSKSSFFYFDGKTIEIRTTHFLFGGIITWKTKKNVKNSITV